MNSNTTVTPSSAPVHLFSKEALILIPLYAIIFVLSVVGNSLVMVTLLQHKRMRTPMNVLLLNLAISDILLGVFCMPFTLTGYLLRNFIFGEFLCRVIPYLQGKIHLNFSIIWHNRVQGKTYNLNLLYII